MHIEEARSQILWGKIRDEAQGPRNGVANIELEIRLRRLPRTGLPRCPPGRTFAAVAAGARHTVSCSVLTLSLDGFCPSCPFLPVGFPMSIWLRNLVANVLAFLLACFTLRTMRYSILLSFFPSFRDRVL